MEETNIYEKLARIQAELKVAKTQRNKFGNYNFRSAEDILEAIKPFEQKYSVTFTVSELLEGHGDRIAVVSAATITCWKTLKSIQTIGTAFIDWNQKGMQDPQKTGSASSYAKKYALGNLLLIDDTKDADGLNKHEKSAPKQAPKAAPVKQDKPVMTEEKLAAAKSALAAGKATIERIEDKYTLTEAMKKQLLS